MTLTIQQQYERDGFAFPLTVLDSDEAKRWRTVFENCEAKWGEHPDAQIKKAVKSFPHLVFPEIDAMIRDQRIVDYVAQVLGDNILCWNFSAWIKEPNTSSYVSWHQDLNYWGLDDVDEVTAWIALSPANDSSGCMRFVRGSHKERIEHRDTFAKDNLLTRGQEVVTSIDESEAVSIELEPGQMSLHHGLLMHASGPNSTDDRRIGLAIRYIKPSMRQAQGDGDYAVLVRGQDDFGHFNLAPSPSAAFADDAVARAVEVHELHDKILYRGAQQKRA